MPITPITPITGTTAPAVGVDAGDETSPGHLTVYTSNRCNLGCAYCYVAVNQGTLEKIDWPRLRAAFDIFFAQVPERKQRVTFLGGEPFLDFPLLKEAILHLRRRGAVGLPITVFTNGTLLDAPKCLFLLEQRVRIVLSLDGRPETNDSSRRFASTPRTSVYGEIMRRLQGLPIEEFDVNMVFTTRRLARLPGDVFHLYRLGFRNFAIYPDLYADWTPARTTRMRRALEELGRLYRALFSSSRRGPPFLLRDLPIAVSRGAAPRWWRSCANIVLSGDGTFHACDKALSFSPESRPEESVGNVESGPDWQARRDIHRQAAGRIDRVAPNRKFIFCPLGTQLHSEWTRRDAAERLDEFAAVNDAMYEFYRSLANALAGNPRFARLYGEIPAC